MTINELRALIENEKPRSAWGRGVKKYAEELVDKLAEAIEGGYFSEEHLSAPAALNKQLLNGADNWSQYSWGGCALIYDKDIAERLCNPSELKKTKGGERNPNSREEWLDVQARALSQASNMVIIFAAKEKSNENRN